MSLYFITGNNHKFAEAKAILPSIEQLVIDLPEIQSLDPQEIIGYKLAEAQKQFSGKALFVEDTSLVFDAWNGLPGPFIKWYLESVKDSGVWQMFQGFTNKKARGISTIGYTDGTGIEFFLGVVEGTIVAPTITTAFGRDALFQPDGYDRTFAHMTQDEKNNISHRGKALRLLASFLGE